MCRSITTLRGLEPAATSEEIEAAARQFVRKISGIRNPTANTEGPFDTAIAEITVIAERLLVDLPPRKQPPKTVPPNRLGHPI